MKTEQTFNYDVIPEVHVVNTPIVSWPVETKLEETKKEQGEPLFGAHVAEAAKAIRKIIGK